MDTQPLCPNCGNNPTSTTVFVGLNENGDEMWQDRCADCGQLAENDGEQVHPIQIEAGDGPISNL